MPHGKRQEYHCSFCGKEQHQVRRLIAGPGGVYICNDCVELCQEIIADEGPGQEGLPAQRRAETESWATLEDAEFIQEARRALTGVLARYDHRLRSVERRLEEIEKKL